MDKLNQWIALTVVAVLAVLAAGWFLLVSPKRQDAADLRQQATEQQQATAALRTQLAVLKTQAEGLPAEQAKLALVAAKLPTDAAEPALIRALATAAGAAGVEFISLTPGALVPVTAATTPAVTTPAVTPATTTATAGTGSVTPSSTASSGMLMSMPLTINVAGGYYEIEQYVASLEDLPRALRITGLTVIPGANPVAPASTTASIEDGTKLTAAIVGSVYVATGTTASTAAVVPAAAPAN